MLVNQKPATRAVFLLLTRIASNAREFWFTTNAYAHRLRELEKRPMRKAVTVKEFVKVTEYLEVKDNGRTVILCHYPIPCFKNHFYGSFHLYGHVHNSFEWNMMEHDKYLMEELYTKPCQMFNVGVMMPWMDYTPRTLDEIIAANSHNEAVRNK